jgi:hypothetical protein
MRVLSSGEVLLQLAELVPLVDISSSLRKNMSRDIHRERVERQQGDTQRTAQVKRSMHQRRSH